MEQTLKIHYLLGKGHSGSTLINLILGVSKNVFSLGELKYLEDANENHQVLTCDCDRKLSECEFWKEIHVSKSFCSRKVKFSKKVAIFLEFLGLK